MSAYDHLPHNFQRLIHEKVAVDCTAEDSDRFFELCERFGILSEYGDSATGWRSFYDKCYVDLNIGGAPEGSMELLKYAEVDWYEDKGYEFVDAAKVVAMIEKELDESKHALCTEDRQAFENDLSMLLSGVATHG